MKRERDESGQYTEQVTLDSVLAVFDQADIPVLTTSEVAEELDCSTSLAYYKLEELVAKDKIHKKKVGGRAVVYISMRSDNT